MEQNNGRNIKIKAKDIDEKTVSIFIEEPYLYLGTLIKQEDMSFVNKETSKKYKTSEEALGEILQNVSQKLQNFLQEHYDNNDKILGETYEN